MNLIDFAIIVGLGYLLVMWCRISRREVRMAALRVEYMTERVRQIKERRDDCNWDDDFDGMGLRFPCHRCVNGDSDECGFICSLMQPTITDGICEDFEEK